MTIDTDRRSASMPTSPRRSRATPVILAAVAAVVLAAIVAGVLFTLNRAPAHSTTTATLDAPSRAYVALLQRYYVPMASDNGVTQSCFDEVKNQPTVANQANLLGDCGPQTRLQLTEAQALLTQLGQATPPARWKSANTALVQADQAIIALLTEQYAAIVASDLTRYLNTASQTQTVMPQFCAPIAQLNAGPPRLSPALPLPDSSACK